ncbi:uncharacterized protein SCHCODRAFT_02619563 [Schizophyllum commune H4-8]|uniref:uncharacterized protein n=1 Tax=Schizophyllum commune (strain H4-8 / FGSC 9210) TaxID=578458 RepID=UPI00215F4A50|nr:uncharacterized protein SCHCODRAFT_02619563 [Schizophyllum commune H4-8]KAI5895491.1 hypothetical protein SCHCODRAFT_02619563 [Schizophyllum commune H4-8]
MLGKICISVAWFASAARCVARSICACTPAMSSPGVGVRDTEYGGVRGGGVRGGVPPRNCVACERKDDAEFEDCGGRDGVSSAPTKTGACPGA